MAECSINRDWIMVRLQRETHRALRELGELWDRMGKDGHQGVPFNPDQPLSLDAIVRELLKRDQRHNRPRAKNSESRKSQDGPWDANGKILE